MRKIYISSVSEEGVPNVQYIKEFKAEISTYLFISTNWMQEKNATDKIITTCNLPENTYKVIVVNEESLIDIKTKIEMALTDAVFADSEGFIVNCTLGTKIMSIALYDVFHKNQSAKLLYTPIRTNHYRSVLDDSINETFTTKLNLQEYINSYRIDITGKGSILKAADYTAAFKKKFVAGFKQDVIEKLRLENNGVYLNKGVADTTLLTDLNAVLKTLKFTPNTQNQLSAAEVRYLTGGWLEEWVYALFKKRLKLQADEIAVSITVNSGGAQNELDVAFMYKNVLYIIECKTGIKTSELNKATIYKSDSLALKFGKNVHTFLFTFSNLRMKDTTNFNTEVAKRAAQQNVVLADRRTLEEDFESFFKTHFS